MKKIITAALPFALFAMALTSCGGSPSAEEYSVTFPDINGLVPPTNLKVKKGQDYTATIGVNQVLVPGATLPEDLTKVTSGNGVLTKGEGYTYDLKENNTKADFKIPAKNITGDIAVELSLVTPTPDIKVTSIEFTLEKSSAHVGEQVKIQNIKVLPEDATNPVINWSLSDSDAGEIHTMGAEPYVIGKTGTTEPIKVIATAADGSGVKKEVDISFEDHSYVHHTAVAPTRDDNGNIEYYECSKCGKYFDADYNEISEEDIVVPNSVLSVDIEEGKSYALPDLSLDELLVIDIKIDEGSSFKFFLGDGWDNYIGNFEVKKTNNGSYTVTDNWVDGISYNTTEDGYFRMIIDYNHVEHGQNIESMTEYNLIYIFGLGTGTTGKIMINPAEGLGGNLTRGYKLNASNWVYLLPYTHTLDEYLTIDVKFISNDYNCIFCLYDDWDDTGGGHTKEIQLNPATGAIVDQRSGVQVYKVEDAEGFTGGYYHIVINLAYFVPNYIDVGQLSKVNRIAFRNNNCQAYVDVDSVFDIPYTTYFDYPCSTTEDTKIETRLSDPIAIQDGEGNYYCDKAIVINVKATGGGAYVGEEYDLQFSIQSNGWGNCGNIRLAFDNGAICKRIMQGSGCGGKTPDGSAVANYWPTYTNNADGTCTLYIEIGKLNGNGWDVTTEIGLLYDNPGITKNTVTSFAIDLNFQLIDVGDIPQL